MPDRSTLLPILASAFSELGYRRATTAALAQRCQVQETILYRIWPDKKAMFVEAIDFVGENNVRIYREVLGRLSATTNPAQAIIDYESGHIGEFRNYRIVFSALAEAADPDVSHALQRMYTRIHAFAVEVIARSSPLFQLDAVQVAWGLIGLGTMVNILDELQLLTSQNRQELFHYVSRRLIDKTDSKH
ncbi:MAG: hypothetical protein HJJLKODD_00640 [Phycisphaerae bacterium]|nr:hypothetical protein [Phycisphaerae bacterium]